MWKWRVLALVGWSVGAVGIGFGYAQQKVMGFYELRTEFAEVVTKRKRNPNIKLNVKVHNIDMVPATVRSKSCRR